ncbi:MAG: sigma-70 family RNA polymerase sigma factor [Bacteroidota bacterium]|nr:sigma-70 family RNA polymerase sigma factor [Bacteroidota bacterium]
MDLQEFKNKVFPLKNRLCRLAKQILGDEDDACDVVQDAFVKLWDRREKLDEYRSVEALAVVMTRNLCLDRIKSKKHNTNRLDNLKDDVEEPSMESQHDLAEIVGKIRQIIQTLPEQQKSIIHLRDIEGYEFNEIASILNMNENSIRVNLSRARKKVREYLVKNKLYDLQRN